MAQLRREIGTFSLFFILFFCTSGGPYTTETLIASVGPGVGLLILLLIPIVWSLPEALIVGELASMLPEEGGYYRWVDRAFGRFWGFQNGWLTWIYSLVDMALYPVLFNQYMRCLVPGAHRWEWLIALAVIWCATGINLRGGVRVGRVSIAAGSFVMLGFLVMSVCAVPRIVRVPWEPFASENVHGLGGLALGISIGLWNYIGWDNASTAQGEVRDASRSYPRALALALPFVTLGYLVPLIVALGATNWKTWSEGAWPQIAAQATGGASQWIAVWIALGGMVSALALFNALLLGYSRIPFVMAGDELLPKFLARLDDRGTPRNAVIISAVFYSLFALLPFSRLVIADVVLYSLALFLEFGALIRLRKTQPSLRGAFRIPLGRVGVTMIAVLPVMVLLGVIAVSVGNGEYGLPALAGSAAAIAAGPIVYGIVRRRHASSRKSSAP
ncbi:MAG: APC family permease [Chthoniobacterales bacterium]|nr:APC family permease [Chthoniobacterales bacterium]